MSEIDSLLEDSAGRLFADRCTPDVLERADAGVWPAELWARIEGAGLPLLAVPERFGGAGGTIGDAAALIRLAGRYALPLPLPEAILTGWLLACAGAGPVPGPSTLAISEDAHAAPTLSRDTQGWWLRGALIGVPFASRCQCVVLARVSPAGWAAVLPSPAEVRICAARNIAGEPRDRLEFGSRIESDRVHPLSDATDWHQACRAVGALARCQQIAGAVEWILERTLEYAGEREQFGRAVGQFQAVQQMLAEMAGHVTAVRMAADAATVRLAEAFGSGGEAAHVVGISVARSGAQAGDLAVAFAKSVCGEAGSAAAALAHQVHGAIGFSREYALHHRTRRIWAWRDEYGCEREWQIRAGRPLAAGGGRALWPALTD